MSLNKNTRPLKSQERLEREYYRRDEAAYFPDYAEMLLPRSPKPSIFWDVPFDKVITPSLFSTWLTPTVCMHCSDVVYDDGGRYVHAQTGSLRCYRDLTLTAQPIPGILIIEELELG